MIRNIIEIDDVKCNGCGLCVPNCAEGALQIIDGKARLISDLFCDGLGACIGFCPEDAIKVVEREAEPYDEWKVMDYITSGGSNVIKAHLTHLREHNEFEYLAIAKRYLIENGFEIPEYRLRDNSDARTCPGSAEKILNSSKSPVEVENNNHPSELSHWPIQLHLVSPVSAQYRNSDLLLAADCAGFSYPDLHRDFMKGRSIAIACPKLDTNKQAYLDKLIKMITEAGLKSITVLIMQVPCCGGLVQIAKQAAEFTGSSIQIDAIVLSVEGNILNKIKIN